MGHGGMAQWDDTRVGRWDMGEQTVVALMRVARTRSGTHKPHSDTRGGQTAHRGHSEVTPMRASRTQGAQHGDTGGGGWHRVGTAGDMWGAQQVIWGVHSR